MLVRFPFKKKEEYAGLCMLLRAKDDQKPVRAWICSRKVQGQITLQERICSSACLKYRRTDGVQEHSGDWIYSL